MNDRQIAIQRRAILRLLPDRCILLAPVDTQPTGGGYKPEVTRVAYLYQGTQNIPCRMETRRNRQNEQVYSQEITLNDYTLYLPPNIPLTKDWIVVYHGVEYEVRQYTNNQSWAASTIAIVVESV